MKRSLVGKRFQAYMAWSMQTQRDVARELGVTQVTISMIMGGRRKPGLDLAVRIERLTAGWPHGPIAAAEWTGR